MRHWVILDDLACGTRFIVTEDDKHPRDCGYAGVKVKRLPRAPTDHCSWDGHQLVTCAVSKARAEREATLAHMTRAELVDHILALIEVG